MSVALHALSVDELSEFQSDLLSGMSAGKGQSGAIMIGLAVGGCTLGSGLLSHFGVLWGLVGLIAGGILGSLMASAVVMLLDHLDDELNVLQRQLNRVNAHLQPGVNGSQHNGLSFADRRAMYRFNKAS